MATEPTKHPFRTGMFQGVMFCLVALATLAAVSPSAPPVRLVAGSGMSIVTNALNYFTLTSTGGMSDTPTQVGYPTYTATAISTTADADFYVNGEGTDNSDIVKEVFRLKYEPAP